MKDVSLIVSHVSWDNLANSWRLTLAETIFRENFFSVEDARKAGEGFRGERISVLIRPNYNEENDTEEFFREWRSFNGEDFAEVRWNIIRDDET